jgi:phytoene desaturase
MKRYFTPVKNSLLPASSASAALVPAGAPKAIVIGSGFGGLAAAIRLSCLGYRVEVFEKLDAPGGRAYVLKKDGYTWDAGPTIVTAPFMLEELWALCGKRLADDVTLHAMDPFYRVRFDDGTWFDYSGDPERMRAEVARFSPEDLPGYARFLEEAADCYKRGFEDLGPKTFDGIGSLLQAVPALMRMRGWRSLYKMVSGHLRNPKLRIVMSFHPLLIGGNPFSVTCVYSLINILERRFGVHWAMGGTGSIIKGMVNLLAERGVPVHCNAEVKRITVQGGQATGIELADGTQHRADIVVSNADSAWTYRHLVEPQHRKHWTDQRIARGKYSMSCFVWYFGTDRKFTDVPHHMMVMGPRYEGLVNDIFKGLRLTKDFSLYLHRPTATDPSMAPAGHDAFYALVPVPHLGSGTDWAVEAEPYRQRVMAHLEATVLPGLSQHVTSSHMTTPQDFQDRLLSYQGAAFGLEPLLLQSAWFRPHNSSEDVRGLYMVGASTHPGAGVPGVLMSAKALESVVPHVHSLA